MLVEGNHLRALWYDEPTRSLSAIDQRRLPFRFEMLALRTSGEIGEAIRNMSLRGAPVIGVAGAFATAFRLKEWFESGNDWQGFLGEAARLRTIRPTAVNLAYGVDWVIRAIHKSHSRDEMVYQSLKAAITLAELEVERCRGIGLHGLEFIRAAHTGSGKPVNILTHCNAGWLACVDWGTALSPVFMAHREGIPVHVWVDETRPRNQGARLTAWELFHEGIPFTVIADNTGGQLMQTGQVDLVLTGADRIARNGDVVNKVGTYLKALAAHDCGIPFYVAAPSSSFDPAMETGQAIAIEERDGWEMRGMEGILWEKVVDVEIIPGSYPVLNLAFDLTPARLVTGLITEKGIIQAGEAGVWNNGPC